jgi:MFS transporter, Spinster family, sphingosine-1-phosphate transporter
MDVAVPVAVVTAPARARSYATRVLWIMFAINFLNYMDRFILPSVLTSIQKEFHISDFQSGLLATAFTLVYAMAALPFGIWADRGIRKNVVATGVGLWSLATMFTGAAGNFVTLFISRAAVGVGEAGYYPAGTSLLVDYFPKEKRAWMLGLWNVGASLGVAVGFALGGLIADHLGWRYAFYLTAIPGAICTVLAFRMREPRRGAAPSGASSLDSDIRAPLARTAPPFMVGVRAILKVPTMRIALIAQTMNFFVLGASVLWFPTLLQRRFTMSESKAGLISGGVLVLAGIIGTLGGGWLADRLIQRFPSARLLVTGWAFLLSAPLLLLSLLANSLSLLVPLFFLAGICLQAYNGPMSALMQDVVAPELRAVAVALSLIVAHILGDAFSPSLVGGLSDVISNGHKDIGGHHLVSALEYTLPAMILAAGVVCMLGLGRVQADTQAIDVITVA